MNYVIYTDGSSLGNPGDGGFAYLIKSEDFIYEYGEAVKNTTNNKMELRAIIEALKFLKDKKVDKIILYSDSKYVLTGITDWIYNWKKNNWKTADKKDVKNKEYWLELDSLREFYKDKLSFLHIKGHSGDEGNDRVDFICTELAKGKKVDLRQDEIFK